MRKNSIFLLLFYCIAAISCREDVSLVEKREAKIENHKRFSIFAAKGNQSFSKQGENSFDYATTFAFLAQRYDSVQKTNFTGLVNTVNEVFEGESQQLNIIKEAYEPYVEFRMFSSVFMNENNDVWMIFPRIDNNSVTDLVAAVLTEDATQLHYYDVDRSSDFYQENLSAFQKSFNNSVLSSTDAHSCGFEDRPPCDIEIVIIQFPSPISYIPPSGVNNIGGGCSPYVMCQYDDSGGGGSGSVMPPLPNVQNPCEKIKKVGKNQKTKDLMGDLKTKTGDNKENGYVLHENNGSINESPFQGPAGKPYIDVPMVQMDGFVHSHFDGNGLSVPSLGDIFAIAILYNNGYVNNVNTFVVGVVTSSSQYLMVIDNPVQLGNFANSIMNGNEIHPLAESSLEWTLQNTYNINQNNNLTTNKEKFVDFLRANNTGLKLVEVSDDYSTYKALNQNSAGGLVPQNCP